MNNQAGPKEIKKQKVESKVKSKVEPQFNNQFNNQGSFQDLVQQQQQQLQVGCHQDPQRLHPVMPQGILFHRHRHHLMLVIYLM